MHIHTLIHNLGQFILASPPFAVFFFLVLEGTPGRHVESLNRNSTQAVTWTQDQTMGSGAMRWLCNIIIIRGSSCDNNM